jgi:uncharacterized membrane protein HdeD (DUF308 family)
MTRWWWGCLVAWEWFKKKWPGLLFITIGLLELLNYAITSNIVYAFFGAVVLEFGVSQLISIEHRLHIIVSMAILATVLLFMGFFSGFLPVLVLTIVL